MISHPFRLLCTVALLAAGGRDAGAQRAMPRLQQLQRLLTAEDARGLGADSVQPLIEGAGDRDPVIRRVAVRGIGRLQRPEMVPRLTVALSDAVPAVRAEAANAIAQSVRHLRRAPAADPGWRFALDGERALLSALGRERNDPAADAIAEAVGRLPFDSSRARAAERMIRERAGSSPGYGALHAFYTLALARRQTGNLEPESIGRLKTASRSAADPRARRMAMLTLGVSSALDSGTTLAGTRDADDQVRRLALTGVAALPAAVRSDILARALRDTSIIVRAAAVALARARGTPAECAGLIAATGDAHPYVAMVALDSLGPPCPTDSVRATLAAVLDQPRTGLPAHAWQAPAHALVSLARADAGAAAPFIERFAAAPRWQERLYAARSAAITHSVPLLLRLAADSDDNVREAAVAGLIPLQQHAADSVYITVLGSEGNQAVLMAAQALAGSTHPAAVPALFAALDRLSARRSENPRDPRLMILRRIGELGRPADSLRLAPYTAAFDTTVAAMAGVLLTRWTGHAVAARPARLPISPVPLAAVYASPDVRLRVTLAKASGGGSFVVRLFTDEAPATAARIIGLARSHYYDGVVLHRVEPNFVWQGGGPGASEYIGNPRFMRDELAWRSHLRGTLGISSRGRDTGDAQWFLNLADNPLLDHEYTVFGEIVSGRAAAERIVEGDTIARVDVLGAPAR